MLCGYEEVVLFHGHKHIGYRARRKSYTIISGPSVAYGDRFGGSSSTVYGLTPEGHVSVIENYDNGTKCLKR